MSKKRYKIEKSGFFPSEEMGNMAILRVRADGIKDAFGVFKPESYHIRRNVDAETMPATFSVGKYVEFDIDDYNIVIEKFRTEGGAKAKIRTLVPKVK